MDSSAKPWFSQPLGQFASRELTSTNLPPVCGGQHHDPDALHEIFHETTKYHRGTMAGIGRRISAFVSDPALIERGAAGRHDFDGFDEVPLPEPQPVSCDLAIALQRRRSADRKSLFAPLSLAQLSTVLRHSLGANARRIPDRAPHIQQTHRPYPSGGGLYPCEFYVAHPGEGGVQSFIAHYDPATHTLRRLPGRSADDIRDAEVQTHPRCAPCAILVTGIFQRSIQKYGARGYRLSLIEAGHALQNILLVTSALGGRGLVSASFFEAEAEGAIDADGVSECALAIAFISG